MIYDMQTCMCGTLQTVNMLTMFPQMSLHESVQSTFPVFFFHFSLRFDFFSASLPGKAASMIWLVTVDVEVFIVLGTIHHITNLKYCLSPRIFCSEVHPKKNKCFLQIIRTNFGPLKSLGPLNQFFNNCNGNLTHKERSAQMLKSSTNTYESVFTSFLLMFL